MILDFREIPEANGGEGLQDTFELFARDFLSYMGYRIVEDPARGADGKKDLIVEEVLVGVASEQTIRWLVSCKHYAHSGRSVPDSDEINITERLGQHNCDGFMGFYSTLPAVSLQGVLKGVQRNIVFDREKIESYLLRRDIDAVRIASRYFPVSFKNFQLENPLPAELYDKLEPLTCDCCGKNILEDAKHGIYAQYKLDPCFDSEGNPQITDKQVKRIYFACKGECDELLKRQSLQMGLFDNGWNDVADLCIPTIWIKDVIGFINGIYRKELDLNDESFEKLKQLYIITYQYVARNLTTKEKERFSDLLRYGLV